MADQKTEAIKYWKITADGLGTIGMFNQCGAAVDEPAGQRVQGLGRAGQARTRCPPASRRRFGDVHALAAASTTRPSSGSGSRQIAQKGASADTVKEVTLMACDAEGSAVQDVEAQATPSRRRTRRAGMAAAGTDVLTEQISIQLHGRAARRPGRPDRLGLGRTGGGGR